MVNGEKKYTQNGKTIKIVPVKRVKKAASPSFSDDEKNEEKKVKKTSAKRTSKAEQEKGKPKFAVGDKVALKNIPVEYSGAGFAESVITKLFKSSYDQTYRYSIRSYTGHDLPLVKEELLKPRK